MIIKTNDIKTFNIKGTYSDTPDRKKTADKINVHRGEDEDEEGSYCVTPHTLYKTIFLAYAR